ncbi:MAG TPA: ABC-type transport auxiliary lipoprotein family protein [Parvibaculum sp.]
MKKRLARLSLVLLLSPLGACALADVGSGPAPRLFTLTSAHPVPPAGDAAAKVDMQVAEFAAPAAIDTTRIVFQSSANEIKYYAEGRWSDSAPNMIQMLVSRTLQDSGGFASVSTRGSDLNGDFTLVGDIRQFAAEAGDGDKAGDTSAHVDLFLRLVRVQDHKIVASKDFNSVVPVAGSGIASVIAAYDAALHAALDGIALWTLEETAKAGPAS